METETLELATHAATSLSGWALFMQADIIVKFVMVALVVASICSWAIIFDKISVLKLVKLKTKKFEERFWSGGSLDELFEYIGSKPTNPMAAVFVAAMKEWKKANISKSSKSSRGVQLRGVSLQQRIEKAMQITLDREIDSLENKLGFLASTGSVSPFVGLFGTVWGIMNSFNAIGAMQNTSLAIVAPGIAEALFATALGLVAAIPAVVAYNKFSTDIDRYAKRLENFSGEFATIMSRQIDATTQDFAGE